VNLINYHIWAKNETYAMIASLTKTKPFLINTPQKNTTPVKEDILDIKIKKINIFN